MMQNELSQIFNTVNIGLVILDRDLKVTQWNRWMAMHSGISAEKISGSSIFDYFPELANSSFNKNCKAVLSFGNFAFFSQKLHRYLFPFKPESSFGSRFDNMQQSCVVGPLRSEDNTITSLFLVVQDVTELAEYEQRLVELNTKDGLTGIYNRRFLESRLEEELERNRRYSRAMSLIMMDIDFFKKVNDTYGHQGGDAVLKSVAAKTASIIRKTDIITRFGGEEFCCILPETDANSAEIIAEKIRTNIEQTITLFENKQIQVTISLGISTLGEDDSTATLLKRADDALYQAKQTGRNRFVRF